jgi:hypothetical protein
MLVGFLPQLLQPLGRERGGHLPAGPALAAGLRRRRPLAQGRLGDREGQQLLAHAVRPREEEGGRQPVALQRAGEDGAHPVVAAHVGELHGDASPTRPRATSPDQRASKTASGGAAPSSSSQREGSSPRSDS